MPQAYNNDHTVTPADLKTVPFDARFPYANQTKNCWQNYVDFRTPISLILVCGSLSCRQVPEEEGQCVI